MHTYDTDSVPARIRLNTPTADADAKHPITLNSRTHAQYRLTSDYGSKLSAQLRLPHLKVNSNKCNTHTLPFTKDREGPAPKSSGLVTISGAIMLTGGRITFSRVSSFLDPRD